MASENLTFDVLARDRASATFNKISHSTEVLESRFTRLTRAATGIATTLVGAQIGKSVLDAADKFELSRSRLETITKNIGQNFDGLSKQVGAADDRMEKLGFTNADTENSLAALESVTRDPIKAFRDLALAADIAKGRNIGLSESTLILQRVETGHIAQLAKLGIQTKDAAGHTLTQTQALQMLTDLYGGAATAAAGTFAGKQAAVGASLQDSAAKIGVALLPAAVDLAAVLQHDLLPPIEASAKFLDRNRQVIEPLTKAVLVGAAAWKSYVLWTRLAAASNALFTRSAVGAAVGATTAAGAARIAGGVAVGGAAAAGGAGTAIGTGMAAGLTGANVTLANSALLAARNIGLMGFTALGLVNFVKNPKSLGFPMGFNTDLGPGRNKVVGGAPARYFDKQGRAFSDPDLKHAIVDTSALKAATDALTTSEGKFGAAARRTASQIEATAQHTLGLRSAQDGLRSAMQAAAQTAADNGKALAGNSDAALANRDALRNQVAQIFSVIDAMKARGANDAQQASMLDVLTQAVEQNATKLYGDKAAVDAFLASLGLIPGQVAAAVAALASLPGATQAALNSDRVSPGAIHQLNQALAPSAQKKAKDAGAKVAASFTSGYTPIVSKAAGQAAKAVSDSMQKALEKVNSDLQTMRDAIASTRSTIAGFAAFDPSGTDTLGASGVNSDFTAQKQAKAAQLEQFASLYARLTRAGLNADDLHEFVGLGPAAIPAMQTLLSAGRSGIRQENALDVRINRAAGSVATRDATSQNLALLHRDLQKLPLAQAKALATVLRSLGIVVRLTEIDKRNGKRIVTLTS